MTHLLRGAVLDGCTHELPKTPAPTWHFVIQLSREAQDLV